jgi:hypothetical protein
VALPSGKLWDEGQALPRINPDLVVLDVPPGSELMNIQKHVMLRRQISSFIEIKADLTEDPKPKGEDTVKKVTAQAVDYANIFSSCPLNVAAVGVVIYSTKFHAVFFDRAGVIFSKEYDVIKTFPRLFVSFIVSLVKWD